MTVPPRFTVGTSTVGTSKGPEIKPEQVFGVMSLVVCITALADHAWTIAKLVVLVGVVGAFVQLNANLSSAQHGLADAKKQIQDMGHLPPDGWGRGGWARSSATAQRAASGTARPESQAPQKWATILLPCCHVYLCKECASRGAAG
eukprot:gene45317-50389_t